MATNRGWCFVFLLTFFLSFSLSVPIKTIEDNNFNFQNSHELNVGNEEEFDVRKVVEGLSDAELAGQLLQLDIGIFLNPSAPDFSSAINFTKVIEYVKTYHVGSLLDSPTSNNFFMRMPNSSEWRSQMDRLHEIFATYAPLPLLYGLDTVHGANYINGSVLFPQQIGLAATFNTTHAYNTGVVGARDTAAAGIKWVFSPILDLGTHQAFPRHYETFGEDPVLTTEMGAAMITGYQGDGTRAHLSQPDKVAACMKHFIAYMHPENGQDEGPVLMPDRYVKQYYLPPYARGTQVNARTVMSAYQDLNGIPMGINTKYFQVLRDELKFDGVVVTDFQVVQKLHIQHFVADSLTSATFLALNSTSLDLSMSADDPNFQVILTSLIQSGAVSRSRVQESVQRLVQLKHDLGLTSRYNRMKKRKEKYSATLPLPVTDFQADRALAQAAIEESITLLQNNNNFLPLSPSRKQTILVTGPAADSLPALCGGWTFHWQGAHSNSEFVYGTTLLQGIISVVSSNTNVVYSPGTPFDSTDSQGIEKAVNLAKTSDVVVVAVGEGPYAEVFGNIGDLEMSAGQLLLLQGLISTGKPVVMVMVQGRPRTISSDAIVQKLASVVYGYLPGPDGGLGLAKVIFGLVNPSGRLSFTYPAAPNTIPQQYWHKKSFSSNPPPRWSFGDGLTYSQYSSSGWGVAVDPKQFTVTINVTVTNLGPLPGKFSLLLFMKQLYRKVTPETKILKRFQKAEFGVKQSRSFSWTLNQEDLRFWNALMCQEVQGGQYEFHLNNDLGSISATIPPSFNSVVCP